MKNFQVVSFTAPKGGQKTGFLFEKSKSKTYLYFSDGEIIRYYQNDGRINREQLLTGLSCVIANDSSLPQALVDFRKELMNPASFKKGDVVSFNDDGKTVFGRVLKGGKNQILLALTDSMDVEIPARSCKLANLPEVEGPMAGWQISNFKIVSGHDDSLPYTADALYNGKKAVFCSNDGWGGSDSFSLAKGAAGNSIDSFLSAVKASAKAATGDECPMSDMPGLWVTWDYFVRPTGKSFESYIREMYEDVKRFIGNKV